MIVIGISAVSEMTTEGPSGGSVFLPSPNGLLMAEALNIYADEKAGTPAYYQFSVVKNSDQSLVSSRKMLVSDDEVNFRAGRPENYIKWSDSSKKVVFVIGGRETWSDQIP